MLQIDDAFQDAGLDVFDLRVDVGEGMSEFGDRLDRIVVRVFLIMCCQCFDACGEFVVYRMRYIFLFADELIAVGFELANGFGECLTISDMLDVILELSLPG